MKKLEAVLKTEQEQLQENHDNRIFNIIRAIGTLDGCVGNLTDNQAESLKETLEGWKTPAARGVLQQLYLQQPVQPFSADTVSVAGRNYIPTKALKTAIQEGAMSPEIRMNEIRKAMMTLTPEEFFQFMNRLLLCAAWFGAPKTIRTS